MLTADDVKKIQDLKERGYSRAKVAKALGFSRGTVTKYWGGRGDRVSLTDLKRRFDECFKWGTCPKCGLMYWMPKFLPSAACPGCKRGWSWGRPQLAEKAKREKPE